YYHRGAGYFAFASMPKGLHALPETPYAPDEEKVAELLMLTPDWGTQTFFRGIEKVEAGTFAVVDQSRLEVTGHWRPSRAGPRLKSPDEYAEGLRERLDQAVVACVRGERAVGAHLSSGYDSSAVAATAARLLGQGGGRVHAFTAAPREGYIDASRKPRLVD